MEDAAASSRETGIAYLGAAIAGEIAAVTDAADAREAALAEGEALLAAGAVSHNHLWFRRRAMDAALRAGDWGAVEHHAAALDEYTRSEPLPWADFFVARGRALAAQGRLGNGADAHAGRPTRRRSPVGLRSALPLIEAVLALEVRVEGQLAFNNMSMVLRAAAAGFGLACVLEDRVAAQVADGVARYPRARRPVPSFSPAIISTTRAAASPRQRSCPWSMRCVTANR